MKLTNLEKASDYQVGEWLEKELKLTPYQKDKMRQEETIRCSPFEFYKPRQKEKVSIFWRFTIIVFPIYWLLLFIGLPFTMIITGKWGYGQKFYDAVHGKWIHKLNL